VELLGVVTLGGSRSDSGGFDDVDARVLSAVTRSHLLVHLSHGPVEGGVAVLLVHVVVTSPGLVTHPDAKVLHSGRAGLEAAKDLSLPIFEIVIVMMLPVRVSLFASHRER
jgi:hypothetical protein